MRHLQQAFATALFICLSPWQSFHSALATETSKEPVKPSKLDERLPHIERWVRESLVDEDQAEASLHLQDLRGVARLARSGSEAWTKRRASVETALFANGRNWTLDALREAGFHARYGAFLSRSTVEDLRRFYRAEQAVNAYLELPQPKPAPVPKLPSEERGKPAGTTVTEIYEVGSQPAIEMRDLEVPPQPADRTDPEVVKQLKGALSAAQSLGFKEVEAIVRHGQRRPIHPQSALGFNYDRLGIPSAKDIPDERLRPNAPDDVRIVLPKGYDPLKPWPVLLCANVDFGRYDPDTSVEVLMQQEALPILQWCRKHGCVAVGFINTLLRRKASTRVGMASGYSKTLREREMFRAALAGVRRRLRIDPDRILVTGACNGGHFSWDLAMHSPDVLAAAIAFGGRPGGSGDFLMATARNVPIWNDLWNAPQTPWTKRLCEGSARAFARFKGQVTFRRDYVRDHGDLLERIVAELSPSEKPPSEESSIMGMGLHWAEKKARVRYPSDVYAVADHEETMRNYWVRIDRARVGHRLYGQNEVERLPAHGGALPGYALVHARVVKGVIDIRTRSVSRFTLFFAPEMEGMEEAFTSLGRAVRVRLNRRYIAPLRIGRDRKVLLEQARATSDRSRLVWYERAFKTTR